jgi:peptidoglycan/LPS O-acetylase OafA/YrhL
MRVVARLVIAVAIALALLTLWQWVLAGDLAAAFGEAVRLLFFFMDVGLAVWLILLIVGAVRGWGRGTVVLTALIGVAANFATVIVVGFIQSGAAPWAFMLFALEAGAAFLVGAVVAALVVKSQRPSAPPT